MQKCQRKKISHPFNLTRHIKPFLRLFQCRIYPEAQKTNLLESVFHLLRDFFPLGKHSKDLDNKFQINKIYGLEQPAVKIKELRKHFDIYNTKYKSQITKGSMEYSCVYFILKNKTFIATNIKSLVKYNRKESSPPLYIPLITQVQIFFNH